ncbi:MAG TPA: hypothetical protein PLQ76_07280, partial [bacterium]|nr:hypothetical protein [bacterium]
MNIHTEKAETNESPYGLTLSQVLGLSFFMTFGAALFASGVLAWRAHKRFAAVVLVIFSVVALGAYGLIYVFVPVPAAAAI